MALVLQQQRLYSCCRSCARPSHCRPLPAAALHRTQRLTGRAVPPSQGGPGSNSTPISNTSSSSSSGGEPVAATSNGNADSLATVGKLAALSFVGGLLIKYGSLLVDLPFRPNAALALALVLGTPAAYSLYFLTRGQQ